MRWRERGVFRRGISLAAALGCALVAHNARAVTPPAVGTGDAQLRIPALFDNVVINLRDVGAITGSPALRVDATQVQLLLNERPISGLVIRGVESGGPGDVCISIENGNFNPPVEGQVNYTMQLAVSSTSIPTPVFGTIGVANVEGPVVDTEEEIDACGDPNTAPIANTSNTVTTVRDDEVIVLDGSGSSDIDAGTVLSYEWSGPNLEFPPSQQPTAEIGPLPVGQYTFTLIVRDDSQTENSASERSSVTVTVVPGTFPVADAGADQSVDDRNADGVEAVTLTAIDPDNTVARFVWSLGEDVIGEGQSVPYEFEVGTYEVSLEVFDEAGRSDSDEVSIVVRAARPPTSDAGEPQSIQDTDGVPGEDVVLSGSGADPDGNTVSFQWFANDSLLGTGIRLETRLPDGVNEVELIVTDSTGQTGSDTVVITIANAIAPTANAGDDRRVADSDGQVGESVTLNGSASVANGGIASYEWRSAQNEVLASGVTPTVRLPDGANVITLLVTNNAGATASDTITITVDVAPQAPIANAGADQTIADSDREPGELVTLSGAGTDPNGQTLSYQWSLQSDPVVVLGSQQTLAVRLPDGENIVTLRVEDPDGNYGTDTAVVSVAAPAARGALAELPNLTANKRSMALALDRACLDLDQQSRTEAQLTEDQQAMLTRCNGLYFDNTQENQTQALDALSAEDFAAARTQTLLFSNTLYASVMDRLVALRGGARGLSLAGLNIVVDGQFVPLAQLQEMAKGLLGGGASSDADQAGGLFGDKLGVWARGNFSLGEKDQSAASPRFEADQWALIGGLDYRLTERSVIGASFAYGQSGIEFDPAGEGALDTTSWAVSTYGSLYAAKNFYFDAILNVAKSDYTAERNITYVDGTGLIDADAQGTTDGTTLSGGVSAGYDFLWGRFTLSPTLGAFYIDATIDGFSETGAAGLNLIYDEQNFSSMTGNLGLRMTYAVNTGWGVLLPHVRIDYVREFEDDIDVFGVRFAGDPNANSAPPILVETDNPDRSYWRLATGFSAQFAHGFSGYVEYQRLESFEFISFEDLSVGLRMQKSF